MELTIKKDKRGKNNGRHFHKVPVNTNSTVAKKLAYKDITFYIQGNNDFGRINYIGLESSILKLRYLDIVYVYSDLY